MKQITFNCLKRLAFIMLAIVGFTTTSFAQDWTEIYSHSLAENDGFSFSDPFYSKGDSYINEYSSAKGLSSLNPEAYKFPTINYDGYESDYFAVKQYLKPGDYKFSYNDKCSKFQNIKLFYTKDLSGNKNFVSAEIATSQTLPAGPYTSDEFTIEEEGDYFLGIAMVTPGRSKEHVIADFHLYRKGGAPIVSSYNVSLKVEGNGTVEVKKGEDVLSLPVEVEENTELTVKAEPAAGYELKSLTAAGKNIMTDKKFKVTAETEIVAVFTQTGNVPEYNAINIPAESGQDKYMVRFDDDELGSHTPGNWEGDTRSRNITMSAWVKINNTPNGDIDVFGWGQKDFYCAEGTFAVKFTNYGKFYLKNRYFAGDPTSTNYTNYSDMIYAPINVKAAEWYFITIVLDNDNNRRAIYIDGKLALEDVIGNFGLAVIPDDAVLYVAGQNAGIDVQEVHVWKKALTPSQVFESMSSVNTDEEGLAYLYKFAEEYKEGISYKNLANNSQVTASLVKGSVSGYNYINSPVEATQVAGHPEIVLPETYSINWTVPAIEDGTLSVKIKNSIAELTPASVLPAETELKVEAKPAGTKVIKSLTYTVNNGEAQNIENGEIKLTGNTNISVEFEELPFFDVKVAEGIENGTVTLKVDGSAVEGKVQMRKNVTVEVAPSKDYKLTALTYSVEGNDGLQNVDIKEAKSFTVEGNTIVNATFEPLNQYEVNLADNILNGSVSLKVDGATIEGTVQEGKTVTVETESEVGYSLSALTYSVENGEQDVDIMDTKSFVVTGNTTVNATFELSNYTITWTEENGKLEVKYIDTEEKEQPVENGITEIPAGSTIKVIPTADTENGYIFKSLSYQLGNEAPVALTEEPYEFILNDNATLNVKFGYPSLNWSTGGLKVFFGILKVSTPDNADLINIDQTGAQNSSVEIPAGTTVTVLATVPEDKKSTLEGRVYLDEIKQKLDENATCTFTMPAKETSLKVIYDEIKYSYNVTKEGEGDVQVKVGNISSGAATGEIAKDNMFSVIATPKEGWKLKSLEVKINDEVVTGEEFKATGDVEINVVFEIITYTVNITQPEEGATISVKVKDGEDIENGAIVEYGTELEISIETETGYKVKYLYVGTSPQDEVDGKFYFIANKSGVESIDIRVELELEKYTLKVEDTEGAEIAVKVQGQGGVVRPGVKAVQYGQILEISVAVEKGYILKSLSVNGNILEETDGKYIHTVDGDVTISATVEKDGSSINNIESNNIYYSTEEDVLYTNSAKSVRVYDLNGRLVLNAENQETISLAELEDGIYTAIVDGIVIKLKR